MVCLEDAVRPEPPTNGGGSMIGGGSAAVEVEMEAVMSEVEIPWWEYHKNVQARVRAARGNIHAHLLYVQNDK